MQDIQVSRDRRRYKAVTRDFDIFTSVSLDLDECPMDLDFGCDNGPEPTDTSIVVQVKPKRRRYFVSVSTASPII